MRKVCPSCQKYFETKSDNPSVRCKKCEYITMPENLKYLPVHIPSDNDEYRALTASEITVRGGAFTGIAMNHFLAQKPPSGIIFRLLPTTYRYPYLLSTYYDEKNDVTTLVYLNTVTAAIAIQEK